jgi:hypothetical protein
VHAVGVQANFILPPKNLAAFFKFYDEYHALARPQGRTIVFGFSYTLRIPKPEAPKRDPAKPKVEKNSCSQTEGHRLKCKESCHHAFDCGWALGFPLRDGMSIRKGF